MCHDQNVLPGVETRTRARAEAAYPVERIDCALAAGRGESQVSSSFDPLVESAWISRLDFLQRQPFPLTVGEFTKVRIGGDRKVAAGGDDPSGFGRARQVAAVDRRELDTSKPPGHLACLAAALGTQCHCHVPLHPANSIPLRLAVSYEVPGAHVCAPTRTVRRRTPA